MKDTKLIVEARLLVSSNHLTFSTGRSNLFQKRNFSIDNRAFGWDGKHRGILVLTGAYVYFAEMQCDNGEPVIKKGTVTVVY